MDSSVIKAEVLRIVEKANVLCLSESISDKESGVEMFLQAQKLERSEEVVPGVMGWAISDEFLGACQSLAIDAYNNKHYEEAMKYCKYVRDSYYVWGDEVEECKTLETSTIRLSIDKYVYKRPRKFAPERDCAEIEVLLYSTPESPYYDLQKVMYKKRRATALCSTKYVQMLAAHYYETATCLEEAKESCFFYSLIREDFSPEWAAKKKAAWDKYISMMAGYVTYVFMNPATWMPAAPEANMTWERYSGLSEEVRELLPRKPIDDRITLLSEEEMAVKAISSVGKYQPGVIDLEALWQQFVNHPKTQKVDKQILCFKKKKYNCRLHIGDFVDCCKYLWEQTYKK